ncbi:protein ERGIC-53-like isoform X2 [Rhincodon typus]|uniref:protein ERGIC-53-like isoform X2 n=1 Tax=Rhincodon typus TaxID=259920 RepID=UPI00202F9438|nr:protein ERGIC-53-like isoform X2 [Rhincodon typus]
MVQQVQDIRASVAGVLSKVRESQQSLNAITADKSHVREIQEHIHVVKNGIDSLTNTKVQQVSCPKVPPIPSCTSAWHFLVFILLQSVFFLSYLIHRNRREINSKKFF